jgi:hypothetical protein
MRFFLEISKLQRTIMKKLITINTVHLFSLLAVLSVFLLAAVAQIRDHKAYLDLPGHSIEIGRCYYKTNYGMTCPSCGLTRGFISIENLDLKSAIMYNRLSPFVYMMFVFLGIFNVMSLLNYKFSLLFGKFLALYSILVCIGIVVVWLVTYFLPILNEIM